MCSDRKFSLITDKRRVVNQKKNKEATKVDSQKCICCVVIQ